MHKNIKLIESGAVTY